jgi:hypothetical protein
MSMAKGQPFNVVMNVVSNVLMNVLMKAAS